ncbi:glycosyltransferase family 25 protein [Nocardia sp. NBC_00416]|uniref:glycosyltransferase family 25 protein n=1 Tax=Nocardia sp. NBC_00416 TaxID=2975991 RepID=UPI002E20C688
MISLDYLSTYVVNLPRRRDRRDWITTRLPTALSVQFTSDLDVVIDGREIAQHTSEELGIRLFDWQIDSDNPWWNRPLKHGEIGCSLAHLACWQHATQHTDSPYTLILEDDAVLTPDFSGGLLTALNGIRDHELTFDLLYLGREPLNPDTPTPLPGIVRPGYSHCTYGYVLTRKGIQAALSANLPSAIVPIDEFLPALYTPHPRPDLRAQFPPRITALALDPPLATQRPKTEAGSDTEDSAFARGGNSS